MFDSDGPKTVSPALLHPLTLIVKDAEYDPLIHERHDDYSVKFHHEDGGCELVLVAPLGAAGDGEVGDPDDMRISTDSGRSTSVDEETWTTSIGNNPVESSNTQSDGSRIGPSGSNSDHFSSLGTNSLQSVTAQNDESEPSIGRIVPSPSNSGSFLPSEISVSMHTVRPLRRSAESELSFAVRPFEHEESGLTYDDYGDDSGDSGDDSYLYSPRGATWVREKRRQIRRQRLPYTPGLMHVDSSFEERVSDSRCNYMPIFLSSPCNNCHVLE